MEIGIERNLFNLDYDTFGKLLPNIWLKKLWQFTSKYQVLIPSVSSMLELRRENNVFLMEMFESNGFTSSDLIKLN